jgi:hypothetical protein
MCSGSADPGRDAHVVQAGKLDVVKERSSGSVGYAVLTDANAIGRSVGVLTGRPRYHSPQIPGTFGSLLS